MAAEPDGLGLLDLRHCRLAYGTFDNYNTPSSAQKDNNQDAEYKYKSGLFSLFRYANMCDFTLICIGMLFAIIHGASFPILALIFGQMTDVFIHEAAKVNNNTIASFGADEQFITYLSDYSIKYLYVGVLVLISSFIQTLCWELACERQIHRLHQIVFTQILRQDIGWYDTRQQTNLNNILSDDVERIREGIGCKFSMVAQYTSTFFSGMIVGAIVSLKLTAVLLLVAPFLIGASAFLAKLTAGSAAREQLKYGQAGAVANEVLTQVLTVAAFGKENKEAQRYAQALEAGRKLAMKKYKMLAWGLSVVFFLMYAQYGLAFYYGAILVQDHYCTPGNVFTVFFSVLAGAFTLGNALPYINSVAMALGAASSVFSIIDRVPHIDTFRKKGIQPQSFKGHIQLQNVHFSYPSRPDVKVLRDLNLEISPGLTVAIVGSSGSGKSTIIQLLLRFYDVTDGVIRLDGVPIQELNIKWLRSQIGMVSQEPVLFGVSISENIRYGREFVSQDDIELAATMANIHAFIDDLPEGYNTLVGELGAQLSGGQKQRITLARALVRDPALLLLDEATSALDAENEGIVQEALERAMLGRTTIIVAHRLSTIRNANIIYVLHEGEVVEQGNHLQLMKKHGLYCQLVKAQTTFKPSTSHSEAPMSLPPVSNVYMMFQPTPWLSTIYGNPSDFDGTGAPTMLRRKSVAASEIMLYKPINEAFPEGEYQKTSVWVLLKLHKPDFGWMFLGLIGCAVGGSIMPSFAFFYGEIFQAFTKNGEELMKEATFWSGMFLLLGVVSGFSIWLEVLMMTIAVEKLVMRLRLKAFLNILRQPVGWFDLKTQASGKLLTHLARDAPLIKGASGLRLGQVLSSLVTLVAALTIAFIFGWKLALLLLVVVPLLGAGAYHQTLMLRKNQLRDIKFMDEAGRVASESVNNIKIVQALGMEKILVQNYMEFLQLPYRESKKQALVYAVIYSLSQAVIYVMYAGAFLFGSYLIEIGDMTPTDVYRVFFALAFCAVSVGTSSAYVQDFNKAKMATHLMFRLIGRKSEIDPLSPLGIKPVIRGQIKFERVYFHYPNRSDVMVLSGLTLTVDAGQTVAIVGHSGSGKSTVMHLLERFYQPTSGTIVIDETDISTINVLHLRQQIGLVTQQPALFNQTIRENIAYGLVDNVDGENVLPSIIEAATAANCHGFITEFPKGYETKVGEAGCQLSGGQKQRIAIARALIRKPKILLLDEATSALDTESELIVQEALDRARVGRTCILIAHRLSTVKNADKIIVLNNGIVEEEGTHQKLMGLRGHYYELVKAQNV